MITAVGWLAVYESSLDAEVVCLQNEVHCCGKSSESRIAALKNYPSQINVHLSGVLSVFVGAPACLFHARQCFCLPLIIRLPVYLLPMHVPIYLLMNVICINLT